jgi:ComF family protein
VCELCAEDAFEVVPDRCYRCLAMSRDSAVCVKCRRQSPLKNVWVATEYDGIAKRLVRLLKFERAKAAHEPIAAHITGILPYFAPKTIVVHIPTATSRQRGRGYDQAQLIAKQVALQKGVSYEVLLTRLGQTRQVGATRKQRYEQMTSTFRILKPETIVGAHILLIDDILTTGATLEAAAKVLKQAGAKQVSAAVFAQKH